MTAQWPFLAQGYGNNLVQSNFVVNPIDGNEMIISSAAGRVFRTNTQGRAGRYALLDLGATWQLTPTADVGVQVRNATNRRYVYAWYDSGSSGYSPGDGRSVAVSLGWRF